MKTEGRIRILLILIPWLIITGMVVTAYLPVLRGQRYLMRVKPVDPRDFFRGNYVALSYDFSMIDRQQLRVSLDEKREYRFGDRLYLGLESKDGILTPVALSDDAEKLKSIRLKVHTRWRLDAQTRQFNLDAGLDSFFAPAAEAEAWEKPLRAGEVFAEVAIDGGGNARLTGLVKREVKNDDDENN